MHTPNLENVDAVKARLNKAERRTIRQAPRLKAALKTGDRTEAKRHWEGIKGGFVALTPAAMVAGAGAALTGVVSRIDDVSRALATGTDAQVGRAYTSLIDYMASAHTDVARMVFDDPDQGGNKPPETGETLAKVMSMFTG